MPRRRFHAILLLASLIWLLAPGRAVAEPARRIYAGVYLHDVTKFDQKDGVFDADFELWAKWLGDFDPAALKIANASEVERELVGQEKDGRWQSARWRVRGTLRGEFPVHNFPFDHQTLSVVLELPERYGQLVPDLAGSGMRERFSVTGWLYEPFFAPRIAQETYRSDLGMIDGEGRPTAVRRTAFDVTLSRPLLTAVTKLFLPLLVIIFVAVTTLFMSGKELEVRGGVGVTALLACFAFQFAVGDAMPSVAYLTLADLVFLIAYALCAVLLAVSVAAKAFHERDMIRACQRLDFGTLIALPFVIALAMFVAMPKAAVAHHDPPAPYDPPRPKSERKLLRIGIDTLPRPVGGLTSRGVFWAVIRNEPDGTTKPVLVEEVPAITNDSLRFLADGSLEVTWQLRPNLQWSDGKPFTSDALKFAFEVAPDQRILETLTPDPRKLVVRYRDRVAAALLPITPMPRHALEEAYKKGGFEAVRDFRMKNVLPGAGPYRIAEFVANDHVVLEENPHFVGPNPSIERIEIRRFKGDAALVAAFEKNQIDMIAPNAITPETAQGLEERRPEAVHIRPSEQLLCLQPDPANPLLARRDVRAAILAAIDRERMRNEIFGQAAAPVAPIAHIPVQGALPNNTEQIAYDAAGAKAKLAGLGAAGARFPLLHAATPFDRVVVAHLVRDLGAAGITLEPREVEDTNTELRKRKHGGLLLVQRMGARDDEPERFWNIPQVEGRYDRKFRSDAFTNEVVALVEREERALYPDRREQIRDRLFAAFAKNLPFIPLLFPADRIVAVPELRGWEKDGSGRNFGLTLERWHFSPLEPRAKR
jgi:ABC-type transport system substrate-binding protein